MFSPSSKEIKVWQKEVRCKLFFFFETLRPCAHIFGRKDGGLGVTDPRTDPLVSRLRLTLQALVAFWDPSPGPEEDY